MPLRNPRLLEISVSERELSSVSSDGSPGSIGAHRTPRGTSGRHSPYPARSSSSVRLPPIGLPLPAVVPPPEDAPLNHGPLTTGLSGHIDSLELYTPSGPISSRTRGRRRSWGEMDDEPAAAAADIKAPLPSPSKKGPSPSPIKKGPSPSPSKLRRLRDGASASGGNAKDWERFYSEDSLRQRFALMQHPKVRTALDNLWVAANTDDRDQLLDNDEYLVMHRKITLALDPTVLPREAVEAAHEDWQRDAEGTMALDRDRFCWCWFELADVWTESIEADEYTEFLTRTMDMITKKLPDGRSVWRDDKDVMRAHFNLMRERGERIDPAENLPVCMTRWHAFSQREEIDRRRLKQQQEDDARRGWGRAAKPPHKLKKAAQKASAVGRLRPLDAGGGGGGGGRGGAGGASTLAAAAAGSSSGGGGGAASCSSSACCDVLMSDASQPPVGTTTATAVAAAGGGAAGKQSRVAVERYPDAAEYASARQSTQAAMQSSQSLPRLGDGRTRAAAGATGAAGAASAAIAAGAAGPAHQQSRPGFLPPLRGAPDSRATGQGLLTLSAPPTRRQSPRGLAPPRSNCGWPLEAGSGGASGGAGIGGGGGVVSASSAPATRLPSPRVRRVPNEVDTIADDDDESDDGTPLVRYRVAAADVGLGRRGEAAQLAAGSSAAAPAAAMRGDGGAWTTAWPVPGDAKADMRAPRPAARGAAAQAAQAGPSGMMVAWPGANGREGELFLGAGAPPESSHRGRALRPRLRQQPHWSTAAAAMPPPDEAGAGLGVRRLAASRLG